MNKKILLLILTWILSLVGISFYGGPIAYGFFLLVTAIPVISITYLLAVYSRFRIYQHVDSKTLVANQTVPFYFTLQNEDFFGFSSIRIHYFSSFSSITDLEDQVVYELQPHTGITKSSSLICKYRGEYEVGVKAVEIQDFFRLFRIHYPNPSTIKVSVRPELIHLESLSFVELPILEEHESPINKSYPNSFVRDYMYGDDIRYIHWKSTARLQSPMVRKQDGIQQPCISIILGTTRYYPQQADYLPVENKQLELALALALFYCKRNTPVCTYYQKQDLQMLALDNMQGFDSYYSTVSSLSFRPDYYESKLCEQLLHDHSIFTSNTIFMILEDWTPEALQLSSALNRQQIPVVAFIITSGQCVKAETVGLTQIMPISPFAVLTEVI